MGVKFIWGTPEGDNLLAYIARVSNPANQDNKETAPKLIKYLIDHNHVSPFEMVNFCVEINTSRDIGRQILRHRSFSFQEFSQRYQDVNKLEEPPLREVRLQDNKNRQNSFETEDGELKIWFKNAQKNILIQTKCFYEEALTRGIAKEVARVLLPEGLTPTRMYMNGNLRSWIHFLKVRLHSSAQKEIREIAQDIELILEMHYPLTYSAVKDYIHESE